MTNYRCSLYFGTLDIEGIEADSEMDAKQKAMNCFRPALQNICEHDVVATAQAKVVTPVITESMFKMKVSNRKHMKRVVFKEACREIGKIAEEEVGI